MYLFHLIRTTVQIYGLARLLDAARKEAFALTDKDSELNSFPELKKGLEIFWKGKIELFKTG